MSDREKLAGRLDSIANAINVGPNMEVWMNSNDLPAIREAAAALRAGLAQSQAQPAIQSRDDFLMMKGLWSEYADWIPTWEKNQAVAPQPQHGGMGEALDIERAVKTVIKNRGWPVYRTEDDRGLEIEEYVEFVQLVLAAAAPRPSRERGCSKLTGWRQFAL